MNDASRWLAKDLLSTITQGLVVLGAVGAALAFVLKPLWFKFHRWTSRRAFRTVDASGKSLPLMDLVLVLQRDIIAIKAALGQLQVTSLEHEEMTHEIPKLTAQLERVADVTVRIEEMIGRLSSEVRDVMRQSDRMQGVQDVLVKHKDSGL